MTMRFGRYGMYAGKKCFFTHRNPKTGVVWSDDINEYVHKVGLIPGRWVNATLVQWL